MRAMFDERDYEIFISLPEMYQMAERNLSADLQRPFNGQSWNKQLVLRYRPENDRLVEIKFLPDETEIWDRAIQVQVTINGRAYERLMQGQFGERMPFSDNKIEIYMGDNFHRR